MLRLDVKRHSADHNIYRRYMADVNDCRRCSLTRRCFYRKNAKRRSLDVPIAVANSNFPKTMQNKFDSEKGRKIYPQRFAIVEPVFANIKSQKRLDRYPQRQNQSKHPMGAILHGAQYRKDSELCDGAVDVSRKIISSIR